jgi:aryl-alcohol dehydrogenase-like predicted oxidoreductase
VKLALGTAQFGMPYGIANRSGQLGEAEVSAILHHAAAAGVTVVDTACLYGDSETVLGRFLPSAHCFKIVTKTPKFSAVAEASVATALITAVSESCRRLNVTSVYGLLVHDANDLLGSCGDIIWQTMEKLRADGCVGRIGVSVYNGGQIDALLLRYPFDLIQLPLSLLDQRLLQGGQLDQLHKRNIEVHARSAFLQGVLLMTPETLPSRLAPLRPSLQEIIWRSALLGISPLQAASRFVSSLPQVSAVVCGVDSLTHFNQLVTVFSKIGPSLSDCDVVACACSDERALDPSQWLMG